MEFHEIVQQIRSYGADLRSPYIDGYTQWEQKQKLYLLKWMIDDMMRDSAIFTGEDKFLDQHSKQETVRILKQ